MWIRLISLGDTDGFATRVTEATNTQNQILRRDFAALEPIQARLREDFQLDLGKTYAVQRGGRPLEPSDGCTVDEAVIALACAHGDPAMAVRAKRDPELLWERGAKGIYDLFHPRLTASEVWRWVLVSRAVRAELSRTRGDLRTTPRRSCSTGT